MTSEEAIQFKIFDLTKMPITQLLVSRFKFWIARNSRTIKAHLLIASDLLNENEK
jgi:hypothetical protein